MYYDPTADESSRILTLDWHLFRNSVVPIPVMVTVTRKKKVTVGPMAGTAD